MPANPPQSKIRIGQGTEPRPNSNYGYGNVWHLVSYSKSEAACGSRNVGSTQEYYIPVRNYYSTNGYQPIPLVLKLNALDFLCRECVNAGLRSLLQDSSSDGQGTRESPRSEVREQSEQSSESDSDPSPVGLTTPPIRTSPGRTQQFIGSFPGIGQTANINNVGENGSLSAPVWNFSQPTYWNNSRATTNGVRGSRYSRLQERFRDLIGS